MKLFCTDARLHFGDAFPTEVGEVSIGDVYVRADNVFSNSGKFFHQPSWLPDVQMLMVLLVRIDKVAKAIEAKYAYRYFSQYGVGVSLISKELGRVAKEGQSSLPLPMMYNFDSSLFQAPYGGSVDRLQTAQIDKRRGALSPLPLSIEVPTVEIVSAFISEISHYYLMKIGDMVAFPLWSTYMPMGVGDDYIVSEAGEEVLYFGVR